MPFLTIRPAEMLGAVLLVLAGSPVTATPAPVRPQDGGPGYSDVVAEDSFTSGFASGE